MPELVQRCMASWHHYMPDWEYRCWNEDNFDIASSPTYVQEAYSARKFAFVSDYVRLWALEREGGLYMDVDFEVYKPFDDLLDCTEGAFVGREGSKFQPPMLGVMACTAHHPWVQTMQKTYWNRHFLQSDGSYDMTTNVSYFAALGVHREEWVKIYPVEYFCPLLTTGEYVRTAHTYCEHKGLHSWTNKTWVETLKSAILSVVSPSMRVRLIKFKRQLFG